MFITRFGHTLFGGIISNVSYDSDIWALLDMLATDDSIQELKEYGLSDKNELIPLCFPVFCLNHENNSNQCVLIDDLLVLRRIVKVVERSLVSKDFEKVYTEYRQLEKSVMGRKPSSRKYLEKLLSATFTVQLDSHDAEIHSRAASDMHKLGLIFNNELGEPKQKQYEICYSIISRKRSSAGDIYREHPDKAQFNTQEERARMISFKKLHDIIRSANPLDVISALYLGKRTTLFTKGKEEQYETPRIQAENDITLETGLVYGLFTANVLNPVDTEFCEESVVFNASPFFIRKWHEDKRLKNRKITFVVKNEYEAKILRIYFDSADMSGVKRHEYSFFSFDEWFCMSSFPDYSNILIFDSPEIGSISTKIKDVFDRFNSDAYVYVLSSEKSFFEIGNISYDIAGDSSYFIDSILRIPSGIGGRHPRRKIFWLARKQDEDTSPRPTWTCPTSSICPDGRGKHFVIDSPDVQKFCFQQYIESDASLKEYLGFNGSTERVRENAHFINFSREIRIWYSASKGGRDKSKQRLSVYICCEPEEGSSSKKGLRYPDSLKRTGDMDPSMVRSYVFNEYPYDHLSRKVGTESVRYEIREILQDYYQSVLAGKSITLKTLVYIYPELEKMMNKSVYDVLTVMSKSYVGDRVVELISYDDYLRYIQETYPEMSVPSQREIITAFSDMLDFAVGKGHASYNPIDSFQPASNIDLESRLAAEVRAALTKKSFTRSEFKTVYRALITMIRRKKDAPKAIGLLIRLFTGLRSREVCALRWKDLCIVEPYDFYQFHVYARVNATGKEIEPLKKIDEFRCIPLCETLTTILLKLKEELGPSPNDFIILGNADNKPFRPNKLDDAGKTLLEEKAICEEVGIALYGSHSNKKTDLNQYYGDIFRENFQYYGMRVARFTDDEISYLRGVKRVTTFGIYYCDYANPNSQAMLYAKMHRIDMLLMDLTFISSEDFSFSDNRQHEFYQKSGYPVQLDIKAKPDLEGNVEIHISSNYGVKMIKGVDDAGF